MGRKEGSWTGVTRGDKVPDGEDGRAEEGGRDTEARNRRGETRTKDQTLYP